jgi:DUF4097 and DUF4098 domain-containing protein YvlB
MKIGTIGKVSIILAITFVVSLVLCILTGPIQLIPGGFESETIYQHEQNSLLGINNLNVIVPDADVNIYPIDGKEVNITLTGTYAKNEYGGNVNLSVEKVGETLEIKVIYPNINFVVINRDFNLYIGVPKNYSGDISVFSASGNINVKDLETTEFKVNTASGEIKISNINNSGNSLIRSSSGNIDINNINSENINIRSISGEIICDYIKINEEFYSETSSGDIKVRNLENSGSNFKSISGEITLINLEEINSIATSSGNIIIEDYLVKNELNIKSVSGEVDLDLIEDSSIDLEFESVSGDLDNNFGDVYGGNNKIFVKTTSGDLRIY